jgi:hypothetical protein
VPTRTLRVEISDADHRRLRVLSAQTESPMQELIGRAIVELLDREEGRPDDDQAEGGAPARQEVASIDPSRWF